MFAGNGFRALHHTGSEPYGRSSFACGRQRPLPRMGAKMEFVGWAKARMQGRSLPRYEGSAVPRAGLRNVVGSTRGHGAQERAFAHPTARHHQGRRLKPE